MDDDDKQIEIAILGHVTSDVERCGRMQCGLTEREHWLDQRGLACPDGRGRYQRKGL